MEYTNDVWGRSLTTTGSLTSTVGVKIPYRYRGYRYDAETGLCTLQNRFYIPQIGKFICADSIFNGMNRSNGVNIQAYCRNWPVIMVDDYGYDVVCCKRAVMSMLKMDILMHLSKMKLEIGGISIRNQSCSR